MTTDEARSPFANFIGRVAQEQWERAAVDGHACRASGNHLAAQNTEDEDEPEDEDALTEKELDAEVRRIEGEARGEVA